MSKITEQKEVNRIEEITTGLKCDGCGCEESSPRTNDWQELSAHHDSWGNDSVDSWEYYDCCSPECYIDVLEKCLVEFERYKIGAKFNNMEFVFAKKLVEYVRKLQ